MSQQNSKQDANAAFLVHALERNYAMPQVAITQASQVLDIELDSVPGWASSFDLSVLMNVAITVAAGGAAPNMSPFAPWNIFRSVEVSLGGGPFQRVNPFFYYLREKVMHPGWEPGAVGPTSYAYATSTAYSIPAINAPAGATTVNTWRFPIRIPLQVQHGSIIGHLPMGNAATKVKVRLTVASQLYGTDQYASPLYGGTSVSAAIDTGSQSWVQPNINYRTTPAVGGGIPNPVVGNILNVQERASSFVGAGSLTPIKFQDPFQYLRLWHVVVDGTGAPNSSGVTNFELDLTPGYPQFSYATQAAMQAYFNEVRRRYKGDLPTGVFVFDLWSGSDPQNPNGTQVINGALFQTLQTQVAVSSGTSVASPAKIVTYAEALSPVQF